MMKSVSISTTSCNWLIINRTPDFVSNGTILLHLHNSYVQIRSGEYEGLASKLTDPAWAPDFGPAEFVPSWGGTVTGVRKFLIAYNVNMIATKEQAHR